jgi:uncharacterized protein (DUF433 family)
MQMRPTEYPHIFWNEDKNLPCVAGTRLRVQDVVAHHKAGRSIQAIAADFPPHTRAEICSALAYYYDHKEEMDRLIEEHRRSMEEWRAEVEAIQGPSKARELLKARTPRT